MVGAGAADAEAAADAWPALDLEGIDRGQHDERRPG